MGERKRDKRKTKQLETSINKRIKIMAKYVIAVISICFTLFLETLHWSDYLSSKASADPQIVEVKDDIDNLLEYSSLSIEEELEIHARRVNETLPEIIVSDFVTWTGAYSVNKDLLYFFKLNVEKDSFDYSKIKPFTAKLVKRACKHKKLRAWLDKGVTIQLLFREKYQQYLFRIKIAEANCLI